MSKPTFKPNPNMGEGRASKEEMDYRGALILLLPALYVSTQKIISNNKATLQQKINTVNNYTSQVINQGNVVVNQNLSKTFNGAVATANTNLKTVKSDVQDFKPPESNLNPLQLQQSNNLNNIASTLNYKVNDGLLRDEIDQTNNPEDYLDPAFNEAQNRMDGMGWYGWYKSNQLGLLGTYALGTAILGSLVADWITMGDDNVCDDCLEMEANGPYSVLDWPGEQHYGDRCEMGVPYLL